MPFYIKEYETLVETIRSVRGRRLVTVGDAVSEFQLNGTINSLAILRHDVDRRPVYAVRLAEHEHAIGVRSSYYFRCDSRGRFPRDEIRKIADLGHEVGFHYECLSRCGGNYVAALAQFRMQLEAFREIAWCNTVSMHGAPLSSFNNQDLLVGEDLGAYELLADAALWFNSLALAYFTDTGGRWQASPSRNMRDHVGVTSQAYPSPSHKDFPNWLATFPLPVYISTHPERWADSWISFNEALGRDFAANQAKRVLQVGYAWSRYWRDCQAKKN